MGSRLVGTPRPGLTRPRRRAGPTLGYGVTLFEQGRLGFELGVKAQHGERPAAGSGTDTGGPRPGYLSAGEPSR